MAVRWQDIDLVRGIMVTRGDDNKGRRDQCLGLHKVIVDHLQPLRGEDDHFLFPWHHHRRTLLVDFQRIQANAEVTPPKWMRIGHYGFHDPRRAFGTLNADRLTPDALQTLMQHKFYSTTQRYISMARQLKPAVDNLFVPELGRGEEEVGE